MENRNELVSLLENNIRVAVEDYMRYTDCHDNIGDVSEPFIKRLARDAADAKAELRDLFRKSPVWDEKLQAIVINGNRTSDPDYGRVWNLANRIINTKRSSFDSDTRCLLDRALWLFEDPGSDTYQHYKETAVDAINKLAPKAYAEGKKLSRVFKALCKALGIADETSGSEFQRLYAQLADELSAKKIDFKLYVSINPAHFVTMSNPIEDRRGECMVSCHSFNETSYSYNNGCSGYARDNVTFIAFTASDPDDPETLNNRKTTRQIFAYKPGNGLLLQSRLYNTSGGTYGAQSTSAVYRDLVQREISELEGAVNLWNKYDLCDGHSNLIRKGEGFGGYPDWIYGEFKATVSVRKDHKDDYAPLTVGTWGLCVECGAETSDGMYCHNCSSEHRCDCCDCYASETFTVYNRYGEAVQVCERCLENYYTWCEHCEEYHYDSSMNYVDGMDLCDDCLKELCEQCADCGEYHLRDDMMRAVDAYGDEVWVCSDCYEDHYTVCDECGQLVHNDAIRTAYDKHGNEVYVCDECIDEKYIECNECGRYFHESLTVDGLCPDCAKENKENEEKEAV